MIHCDDTHSFGFFFHSFIKDLLWGRDAPTVVFDEIVTTMKSFETQNS